jgi:hypothetical protein
VLSVGFHAALVWFSLDGAARPAALRTLRPTPLVDPQRLQIVMLPRQTPQGAPVLAQPSPTVTPKADQKVKPTKRATSDLPMVPALPRPSSLAAEPPLPATDQSPDVSTPAQAGSSTRLNLDLGPALQAVERQRSKSPLAAAVDAQQAQTARSVTARAFSALDAPSSSGVSDATLSDGTRLVKFSGGGCMRIPNPAARSIDDTRKPLTERC